MNKDQTPQSDQSSISPIYLLLSILATAIIVGGVAYYYSTGAKNPAETNAPVEVQQNGGQTATSTNGPGTDTKKVTIGLDTIPVTFELPKEYIVIQKEGFEGAYATMLSFGKQEQGLLYKYAPLQIEILPAVYDESRNKEYKPSEYVDIAYNEHKDDTEKAQYIQMFGNKAVRYLNDVDGSVIAHGYIRADQLASADQPQLKQDFYVRITSLSYGTGVEFDEELFDSVVQSLQVDTK